MSEHIDHETGEIIPVSYRRSAEVKELFIALGKAQSEFKPAEKSGMGLHGPYMTLNDLLEATKDGRRDNELVFIQIPSNGEGNIITVTNLLGHSSGQWIESTLGMAPAKFDAQGAGSIISYLRRYSGAAILGVAPEDDDGQAAVAEPRRAAQDTRKLSTASRDAAKREEPPAAAAADGNGIGKPEAIRQFLERKSYSLDVKKAGDWPKCAAWFEKNYLLILEHCEGEQNAKLREDNKLNLMKFQEANKAGYAAFAKRLLDAEEFVSADDASTVLMG